MRYLSLLRYMLPALALVGFVAYFSPAGAVLIVGMFIVVTIFRAY